MLSHHQHVVYAESKNATYSLQAKLRSWPLVAIFTGISWDTTDLLYSRLSLALLCVVGGLLLPSQVLSSLAKKRFQVFQPEVTFSRGHVLACPVPVKCLHGGCGCAGSAAHNHFTPGQWLAPFCRWWRPMAYQATPFKALRFAAFEENPIAIHFSNPRDRTSLPCCVPGQSLPRPRFACCKGLDIYIQTTRTDRQ